MSPATGSGVLEEYKARLGKRHSTFALVFSLLEKRSRPVHIVETGCAREIGDFEGDGRSTFLFGKFLKEVTGGTLETIDISEENMGGCREITKDYKNLITYTVADSVKVLKGMTDERVREVDLFYLDSMDLKRRHAKKSMKHHLKELKAVYERLSPDALVMTDDNLGDIAKGALIKEFLLERGWRMQNPETDYQWVFSRAVL